MSMSIPEEHHPLLQGFCRYRKKKKNRSPTPTAGIMVSKVSSTDLPEQKVRAVSILQKEVLTLHLCEDSPTVNTLPILPLLHTTQYKTKENHFFSLTSPVYGMNYTVARGPLGKVETNTDFW